MSPEALDFQLLFEASPDVLLVLLPDSPRFTAVAATQAWLVSSGFTRDKVLGKSLFELFGANLDDPGVNAAANLRISFERVLATKAADTMAVQKCVSPLAGGGFEAKYCSLCNIPVISPTGEILYILHRAVDVTDLVRASEEGEELRGRTQDMEREVMHRSRELDAANRELDAFSYCMAHDLRAPLRAIDGFGLILEEDESQRLSEAGRRHLEILRSSAQRMSRMIDDLSRLAKIGRGEIDRVRFDLSALVSRVARQVGDGDQGRSVALRVEPGIEVDADPALVQIVLENLLHNAWKFTCKRVDAAVEFGATTSAGETHYHIRDNGAGFDMALAPKLFGVFQRLHIQSEFSGTGVGLATVKRIIERHRGSIWAEAEPGRGATFYFTLGASQGSPRNRGAGSA